MPRMESEPVSTLTVKNVPDSVLSALDDIADSRDTSRSQVVRDVLSDYAEQTDGPSDQYYPTDSTLSEVYEAAWNNSNDDLIISMQKHAGRIAQECKVGKSALSGFMHDLERKGYVRELGRWPMSDNTTTSYRIKPPCADPQQWKYRK